MKQVLLVISITLATSGEANTTRLSCNSLASNVTWDFLRQMTLQRAYRSGVEVEKNNDKVYQICVYCKDYYYSKKSSRMDYSGFLCTHIILEKKSYCQLSTSIMKRKDGRETCHTWNLLNYVCASGTIKYQLLMTDITTGQVCETYSFYGNTETHIDNTTGTKAVADFDRESWLDICDCSQWIVGAAFSIAINILVFILLLSLATIYCLARKEDVSFSDYWYSKVWPPLLRITKRLKKGEATSEYMAQDVIFTRQPSFPSNTITSVSDRDVNTNLDVTVTRQPSIPSNTISTSVDKDVIAKVTTTNMYYVSADDS